MRVVLFVVLAIAAFAAAQNDCYTPDSVVSYTIGKASTTNQVCIGSCSQCVPTPGGTYGIYFTTFSGGQNIWKADIIVDDNAVPPTITTSTGAVSVTSTNGADGIVGSVVPGLLYIGAQNPAGGVHVVDTRVTPATSHFVPAGNGINPYHLALVDQAVGIVGGPYLYAVDIDQHLTVRYDVNSLTGDISSPQVVGFTSSRPGRPSTIIKSPFGFFYTFDDTPYSGNIGEIGTITFSNNGLDGALAAVPDTDDLNGCYHAGFYDPHSDSVLFWGSNKMCQLTRTGDFRIVTVPGVATFDQGTPDGNGHIFVADNSGGLFWFNYKASKDIRAFANSGTLLTIGSLDDVAPLVGIGSAC